MRFTSSEECMKSEMDLFSLPPTQASVESGVWCRKQSAIQNPGDSGDILFEIPKLADEYIDLSNTYLNLKVSIRKVNATDSTQSAGIGTERIGPTNNFFHSLFSQVVVKFDSTQMENTNALYHYKAYLENKLNYSKDEKATILTNELYYDDTPGRFESYDLADDTELFKVADINTTVAYSNLTSSSTASDIATALSAPKIFKAEVPQLSRKGASDKCNAGFIKRRKLFEEGKQVELLGKLKLDISTTNKFLLNSIPITITLTRSPNNFCLIGSSAETFKVIIHNADIRYRKMTINPSVGLAITNVLTSTNAKYPYKFIKMTSVNILAGTQMVSIDNIHRGVLPNKILVAFVLQTAFAGTINQNPYKFENFGLTSMHLNVGGQYLPYAEKLDFDYDNNNYRQAYNTISTTLGQVYDTYEDYNAGNVIYAFNTTPDMCTINNYNVQKVGLCSCNLVFKNALEKAITAIFYLEIDNVFEINDKRVAIPNPIV